MPRLLVRSESVDDTRRIGARLGAASLPGDLICLIGELGAGKTHLTQGIAVGLGISPDEVTSPTYALIAEHLGGRMPLYHMDAYRLDDPDELGPIGFDEYLERGDGIVVIEWADRILSALPAERVQIELQAADASQDDLNIRLLTIETQGKRAETFISETLGSL